MKMALISSLAIAATFTFAAPAEAYEGAWCLQYNLGRSSAERCHFSTFDGCAQERVLQGTTAFCHPNPYYVASTQGRGISQGRPARKKKHHRT